MVLSRKVPSFFLLFIVLLVPFVSAVGFYDNLGVHYSFEEGNGTTFVNTTTNFYSEHNLTPNVISLTGGYSYWTTGILGYGIDLPGNNSMAAFIDTTALGVPHYYVSPLSDNSHAANFSLSFWFKPDVYNQSTDGYGILYDSEVGGKQITLAYSFGYVNILFSGFGTGLYKYIALNNPVLVGEWNHVVLSVQDYELSLYINNNLVSLTNSSSLPLFDGGPGDDHVTLGGYDNPATYPRSFNGTIDEFSYWYNRSLTSFEVNRLYQGGDALPYSDYSFEVPEAIGSYGCCVYMGLLDQKYLFANDIFSNYDEICLSYDDSIQQTNVNQCIDVDSNDIVTYNSDHLSFSMAAIFGGVRISLISGSDAFATDMNMRACNGIGCAGYSFDFFIGINETTEYTTAPLKLANVNSPVLLGTNDSFVIIPDNYFANYDLLSVAVTDPLDDSTYILYNNASRTNYTTSDFNVTLWTNLLKISSYDVEFEQFVNITAMNEYGNTSTSFTVIGSPLYGTPLYGIPVLYDPPEKITLSEGESATILMADHFRNYTSYSAVLYNESGVFYLTTGSFRSKYYYVETVNDGFVITAKNESFDGFIYFHALNSYGSTRMAQEIAINAGAYPDTNSGSAVSYVDSIFPDKSTLTLRQRFGYVFVTMLLIALIIFSLVFAITRNGVLSGVLAIIVEVGAFLYFVAIGYIPIVLVIILGILAGGIVYLVMKRGGG